MTVAQRWALFAILALGCAFRLGTFGYFPPPDGIMTIEETQRGQSAFCIVTRGAHSWQYPMATYLPAAVFALTKPTISAERAVTALLGCLAVAAFFWLARAFIGVPSALVATLFLAVSRWHVETSWGAFENFTPMLGFTLGLALLFHSGPKRHWTLATGAGLLAGMMMFEYTGYRPLLLIAVAVVASRRSWRHAGAFAAGVLPPLFVLAVAERSEPGLFFMRCMAHVHDSKMATATLIHERLAQLAGLPRSLFFRGGYEFFGTLNVDNAPALDPFTGAMVIAGLVLALAAWRRRRVLVAGSFIVLTVVASVFPHNLDHVRLAPAIPFAFLLVGFMADDVLRWKMRRAVMVGLAALVIGAVAWNANFLFLRLAPNHGVRAAYRNNYTTASYFIEQHWRGERVVLLTPRDGYYVGNFFDPTDYTWMLPIGIRGVVVPTLDAAIAEALSKPEPVLIIVQRRLPLEQIVTSVPKMISATCKLYPDADSREFDLAACWVPAGETT